MKNHFRTWLSRVSRPAKNFASRQLCLEPLEERTLLAVVAFDEAFKSVDYELEADYAGKARIPADEIGFPDYIDNFSGNLTETGTISFTGPLSGSGSGTGGGSGSGIENYRPGPTDNAIYTFDYIGNVDLEVIPEGLRRSNAQETFFTTTSPNRPLFGGGGHSPYDPNIPFFIDLPIDTTVHPFTFDGSWDFAVAGGSTDGTYSGTIADTNTTPIDARLLSAELTGNGAGVDFEYDLSGRLLTNDDPSQPVSDVRVFWSSSDSDFDVIGGPIASVPIHWNTSGGVVSITELGSRPDGATHLIVVVDDDELIPDANEENNVIALELPGETVERPNVPGSVMLNAVSQDQIDVSWTDSTGEDGYKVYHNVGGVTTLIATLGADATSYSDTGLSASTRYFYTIEAFNAGGRAFSPWQSVVTPGAVARPTAPGSVMLDPVSQNRIDVSWADSTGEDGYKVYRNDGSGTTLIATLGAGATSYSDTGLSGSTRYFYTIEAFNTGGSAYSPWQSVVTPGAITQSTVPGSVMLNAVSQNQVDISWEDSTGEDGYKVYRDDSTTLIAELPAGATSYSDTGLSASTRYFYTIEAFNAGGRAFSPWQSVVTPGAVARPTVPGSVMLDPVAHDQIDISWTDSTGEDGYKVYHNVGGVTTLIDTLDADVTSYSDTGLSASTVYFYTIEAFNTGGSAYSPWQSTITPAAANVVGPEISLSTMSATPGQILVITGESFDLNGETQVVFTDQSGNEARVPVLLSDVTANTVEVKVPVYIDPDTFEAGVPGSMSVTVVQEGSVITYETVVGFQIGALGETGLDVGTVTVDIMSLTADLAETAITDWHLIEIASGGAVDTAAVRSALQTVVTNARDFRGEILQLATGEIDRIDFGQVNGEDVFVDTASLALLDRVLVGYLLGEDPSILQEPALLLRESRPPTEGPAAASTGSDAQWDYHDKFNLTPGQEMDAIFRKLDNYVKLAGLGVAGVGVAAALIGSAPIAIGASLVGTAIGFAGLITPAILGVTYEGFAVPFLGPDATPDMTEAVWKNVYKQMSDGAVDFLLDKVGKSAIVSALGGEAAISPVLLSRLDKHMPIMKILGGELDPTDPNSAVAQALANSSRIVSNFDQWIEAVRRNVTGVNHSEALTAIRRALENNSNNEFHVFEAIAEARAIQAEIPGISVSRTSGLFTNEGGGGTTFTIVLDSQPVSPVSITLGTNNPLEGIANPLSVVFGRDDWFDPVQITIEGQDDQIDDGDQLYSIVINPAVSNDDRYGGVDPPDVSVTNLDDDTAGVQVSPTSGLVTSENLTTATFDVVLTSQPTSSVTILFVSSDTSEGTILSPNAVFDASNWDQPKTITIQGVDDPDVDGDQPYSILTSGAISSDPKYSGLNVDDVALVNEDNDDVDPFVAPGDVTGSWVGPAFLDNPLGRQDFIFILTLQAFPQFTPIVTGQISDGNNVQDVVGSVTQDLRDGKNMVLNVDAGDFFLIYQLVGIVTPTSMQGDIKIIDRFGGTTTGEFSLAKVSGLTADGLPQATADDTAVLTAAALDASADAAIAQWEQAGLPNARLEQLRQTDIFLVTLPGRLLAAASRDAIYIDRDAAGIGWFVDQTPLQNEEYGFDPGTSILNARQDSHAAGGIDLLTVLAHELGHIFGLDDLDPFDDPFDLMAGTLEPSVRRLPSLTDVDAIFANNAWE
ncbi:MAG: fibronectin type III domain-containing protein [Planctomycetes bacterium]|nr:fibronectin type III domain-containing protein [Planctomycetota bacterium]